MPERIMAACLLLIVVCVILGAANYIDEYFQRKGGED